jgi:DNA-binding HxlR family transcriptional regulator
VEHDKNAKLIEFLLNKGVSAPLQIINGRCGLEIAKILTKHGSRELVMNTLSAPEDLALQFPVIIAHDTVIKPSSIEILLRVIRDSKQLTEITFRYKISQKMLASVINTLNQTQESFVTKLTFATTIKEAQQRKIESICQKNKNYIKALLSIDELGEEWQTDDNLNALWQNAPKLFAICQKHGKAILHKILTKTEPNKWLEDAYYSGANYFGLY